MKKVIHWLSIFLIYFFSAPIHVYAELDRLALPQGGNVVSGQVDINTNNTKDKTSIDNYNKIKKSFSSGKKAAIGVAGFGPQPLAIEISLDGFSQASKKLEEEKL